MALVRATNGGVVLKTTRLRPDLTAALRACAERRVEELAGMGLDGYVLKAGSPSCAIETTINAEPAENTEFADQRFTASSAGSASSALAVVDRGPGLFAEALMRRLPDLAIADEQQLSDPEVRRRFVERVFARCRAGRISR
jgi:uncharacterized protein YbbK (DUF523 family)